MQEKLKQVSHLDELGDGHSFVREHPVNNPLLVMWEHICMSSLCSLDLGP